jgi:hypothetical protein
MSNRPTPVDSVGHFVGILGVPDRAYWPRLLATWCLKNRSGAPGAAQDEAGTLKQTMA